VLGLPGALPVLNDHAVELAIRAALALGCQVHTTSIFARKTISIPTSEGLPDLSIRSPLATRGGVEIRVKDDGTPHVIGVTRLHMEEDAGKSVHDRFPA